MIVRQARDNAAFCFEIFLRIPWCNQFGALLREFPSQPDRDTRTQNSISD